ncbi:MAG: nucleotidyltransferase domain-containing protein [Clostridium sp.]|nr:nucleotidyltransferase domain-containing protein [Clostridium sp.]
MLFGTNKICKKLITEVKKCEAERNFKVIYGAVVGSISKGLQFADSDYDTRFLYINKDFPDRILYPQNLSEKNIIYRKLYPDTCFEKIPFWELSSFLQYLICPIIDNKFSTGLYNVVGWTFLSPYTWDPYGLQSKIVPLMQKIFFKQYFIHYHKNILDKNASNDEIVNAKEYLNILYSALAISWADKYNEFPPIYIECLLTNSPVEIQQLAFQLINKVKQKTRVHLSMDNTIICHNASDLININRINEIDQYINDIRNTIQNFHLDYLSQKDTLLFEKKICEIYEIIRKSIYEEEVITERG